MIVSTKNGLTGMYIINRDSIIHWKHWPVRYHEILKSSNNTHQYADNVKHQYLTNSGELEDLQHST